MSRINGTQNIVFPYTLLTHHSMVCPYTSVGHEVSCFKTSKLIKMLLGVWRSDLGMLRLTQGRHSQLYSLGGSSYAVHGYKSTVVTCSIK